MKAKWLGCCEGHRFKSQTIERAEKQDLLPSSLECSRSNNATCRNNEDIVAETLYSLFFMMTADNIFYKI